MDSNTQPDRPLDALSHDIGLAADRFAVGDPGEMLHVVQARASQRRRRLNSLVGVAAVATLVVSGVIVAQLVDGSDDDVVRSAPVTAPSVTDSIDSEPVESAPTVTTSVSADAAADPTPVPGPISEQDESDVAGGDAAVVPVVPSVLDDIVDPGVAAGELRSQVQLFPWQGGVLAVSVEYEPQPLPAELPPEISEAFPPEVQAVFPDGLPPTIDEATAMLQEAGLLDVVTQILSDNPEVSEAIYSEPPQEPTTTARFSIDGVEWTDIDAQLPEGVEIGYGATSTGERLVVARPVSNDEPLDLAAAPGARPAAPDAIEVLSSTDLVEWSVQTVLVPEPPAELDPAFARQVYVHPVAATESGFVVSLDASMDIGFDIARLLDPVLQERLGDTGYSLSQGDDGITVRLAEPDDPSGTTETLSFTWAELGIDGPPPAEASNAIYRYAGSWDGTPPTLVEAPPGWSEVRAVGDVFVETGPSPRWSADGMEWSPLEPPDRAVVAGVVDADGDVAVITQDRRGESAIHLVDLDSGDWQPVTASELPDGAQPELFGERSVLLADYGHEPFPDPFVDAVASREFAEVDGYRYEAESTWDAGGSGQVVVSTYRVTELATGIEVVSETSDDLDVGEEPFEYLEHQSGFGDGFRILDPATGEPLVTFPYTDVSQEVIDRDGSVIDPATFDFPEPSMEPMTPEHWLLGFVSDGMIVQSLGTADGMESGFPVSIVSLDDVVLVARSNGVISRVTPT